MAIVIEISCDDGNRTVAHRVIDCRLEVPSPVPRSTETAFVPVLVTAKSTRPSPLKSPDAMANGLDATGFRERVVNRLLCAVARVASPEEAIGGRSGS